MADELKLIPQHRTTAAIAESICRRMNERDDMAAKAKASAQGFKGMLDKIDEDIEQLRDEFQTGQLSLLKDDIGIATAPKRLAAATGKLE